MADVTGVYLFNSPWLFRQTLSQLLMFNNIEIGLLIGNFGWVQAVITALAALRSLAYWWR